MHNNNNKNIILIISAIYENKVQFRRTKKFHIIKKINFKDYKNGYFHEALLFTLG